MNKEVKIIAVLLTIVLITGFFDFYLLLNIKENSNKLKSLPTKVHETVPDNIYYGYSELLQNIFQQKSLEIRKIEYKTDKNLINTELETSDNLEKVTSILNNMIEKGNVKNVNTINLSNMNFSGDYDAAKIVINLDFIKNK